MKRRNIIFIIESTFPYYTGGIENWLFNVINRLPDDYCITVISESPRHTKTPFYSIPHHVHLLQYKTNILLHYANHIIGDYARELEIRVKSRAILKMISQVVIAPEETVIVSLGTITPSIASRKFKKVSKKIKNICSARGLHADTETRDFPGIKSFLFKQERESVEAADLLLVNGYDTQAYYKQEYNIIGEILLNGVNIEAFDLDHSESPYQSKERVVVSVGTLIDIKGVNELIKAFNLLLNKYDIKAKLYFVGKSSSDKYKKLAESMGISQHVLFLGNQSNVIPYLKHADVAACLSGGGGFSMAALEAMASKTPIVAWNSPVYRQFNENVKTMELVETNNIEELADKLACMLSDNYNPRELGENAYNEAKKYDWNHVIENLEGYLQ